MGFLIQRIFLLLVVLLGLMSCEDNPKKPEKKIEKKVEKWSEAGSFNEDSAYTNLLPNKLVLALECPIPLITLNVAIGFPISLLLWGLKFPNKLARLLHLMELSCQ